MFKDDRGVKNIRDGLGGMGVNGVRNEVVGAWCLALLWSLELGAYISGSGTAGALKLGIIESKRCYSLCSMGKESNCFAPDFSFWEFGSRSFWWPSAPSASCAIFVLPVWRKCSRELAHKQAAGPKKLDRGVSWRQSRCHWQILMVFSLTKKSACRTRNGSLKNFPKIASPVF